MAIVWPPSEAIPAPTASRLMEALGLICKQPGRHAYKQATVGRIDIPNHLNREFEVGAPNQLWRGDITYVRARGRWHDLAVVRDLLTRRVVGWTFSTRPDADRVVPNWIRPHQFNDGLAPAVAEEKLNAVSGMT